MRKSFPALAVLLLATGCLHRSHAPTTQPLTMHAPTMHDAMAIIDHRDDWQTLPPLDIPRHPAEIYLKDMTIVLDPGHGGSENGATPTTRASDSHEPLLREADVNFRVARLLARLLKDAGVNVIMTRNGDDQMGLKERSEVANNAVCVDGRIGADLFISIHHNASGPKSNYTTIWYHGQVDDAEASLDPARYVAHALADAIHSDEAVTAPVLSDELMYRGSGFGVLRALRVPGFLCECSFITHPSEAKRLGDPIYNLREAYGIYVGLCEWAYDGRPTQSLPQVSVGSTDLTITTTLSEGLPDWWGKDRTRILASTVQVRFDGEPVPCQFDPTTKKLSATLPITSVNARLRNAPLIFEVHFANMFGHHNYPQRFEVTIDPAGPKATVKPLGPAPISTTRPTTRAVRPS